MISALMLLLACPKRNDTGPTVETWLATADTAWEQRGADGLEPVAAALDQAWGLAPADPRVEWRLARLSISEGLVATEPSEALSAFATARAQGLACLDLPASFQDVEGANPFTRLRADEAACVEWTALAWARWWIAFGPAAAGLDRDRIASLADQSEVMNGDPGRIAWTRGLLAAGDGDLDAARVELTAAIEADPDDLWRRADLIRFVGDEEQKAEMLRRGAKTPEDEAAIGGLD